MADRYQENRDTLFVRNLASEVSEETLKNFFEPHGRVVQCTIPKEFNSGRPKSFGFVTFLTEDDAARALEGTNRKNFLGKSLLITYAYGKGRKESRYGSPRFRSRSRSRSPPKTLSIESELKTRCELLSRSNDELHNKNILLLKQNEELIQDLKDSKNRKELLKKELETYKSQTMIFLPCGHHKNVAPREKNLIDDLYDLGVGKLLPEERMNELVLRSIKTKIFYIMEAKFPDIYRCRVKETFLLGGCGHRGSAECCEIRNLKKNAKKYMCSQLVEKVFQCGHTDKTECSRSQDVLCKLCE